ncbi:hypothetical protein AKJ16_DCAP15564 [Drosera capensis]
MPAGDGAGRRRTCSRELNLEIFDWKSSYRRSFPTPGMTPATEEEDDDGGDVGYDSDHGRRRWRRRRVVAEGTSSEVAPSRSEDLRRVDGRRVVACRNWWRLTGCVVEATVAGCWGMSGGGGQLGGCRMVVAEAVLPAVGSDAMDGFPGSEGLKAVLMEYGCLCCCDGAHCSEARCKY